MQVQPSSSPTVTALQSTSPSTRAPQEGTTRPTNENENNRTKSVSPQESSQSEPDTNSVQEATKRLQEFVSEVRGDIQFSLDTDSGKTVVKVVDRVSNEVLRQIPSEEALEIAQALDRFQGLLIKQQA